MDKQVHVVKELPDFRIFPYAKIGSFALTTYNRRYIADEDALEFNGVIETAGYHYRNTTRDLRFPRKGFDGYEKLTYPYLARPIRLPAAAYVDIRRAFYQIGKAFGYEVVYEQGKYCAFGSSLPDASLLTSSKLTRGLLVTAHLENAKFAEWNGDEILMRRFPNSQYAPYFTFAIWRCLHAVLKALDRYIYYAHTDGFITPLHFLDKVEKRLQDIGLEYAIKATGFADVRGTGSYDIGGLSTVTRHRNKDAGNRWFDEYDKWWLDKLSYGISLRNSNPILS